MTASTVSCPSHCCPVHGCKYDKDNCPVTSEEVAPEYPPTNGCEQCQFDAEQLAEILTDEVRDKIVAESTALQALKDENEALRKENQKLRGHGPGPHDVGVVVFTRVLNALDSLDAYNIARRAIYNALRDQGTQNPETGTTELTLVDRRGEFGPVKIAHIGSLNDSAIISVPGSQPYRFWDLTREQIEEMNQEAAGG